ncbi:MAG: PCYCGC motif-containing (lipo)protein [Candidatus Bipolaricaulia bacterium]
MRTKRRRLFWIGAGVSVLLFGLLGLFLAGRIGGERATKGRLTIGGGYTLTRELPAYARQDDYTLASYMIAVAMPQALELIPCYCSCDAAGHEDLADCFLKGKGFNSHAANCGICKVEAVRAAELLLEEGKSIKETRAIIEQQFGSGRYGRPTPTPPIMEELYLADLAPGLDREALQRALRELLD